MNSQPLILIIILVFWASLEIIDWANKILISSGLFRKFYHDLNMYYCTAVNKFKKKVFYKQISWFNLNKIKEISPVFQNYGE